jgi:hypothetical protein
MRKKRFPLADELVRRLGNQEKRNRVEALANNILHAMQDATMGEGRAAIEATFASLRATGTMNDQAAMDVWLCDKPDRKKAKLLADNFARSTAAMMPMPPLDEIHLALEMVWMSTELSKIQVELGLGMDRSIFEQMDNMEPGEKLSMIQHLERRERKD